MRDCVPGVGAWVAAWGRRASDSVESLCWGEGLGGGTEETDARVKGWDWRAWSGEESEVM